MRRLVWAFAGRTLESSCCSSNDSVVCTCIHWNCIFVALSMYANKIRMSWNLPKSNLWRVKFSNSWQTVMISCHENIHTLALYWQLHVLWYWQAAWLVQCFQCPCQSSCQCSICKFSWQLITVWCLKLQIMHDCHVLHVAVLKPS